RRLVDSVGVSTAARYVPASDEVGGDWYDLFELPGGRLGGAIGDVVGHGVRAAAFMGQVRTALRAYALEGHGPARTLELLDRYVQTMPDFAMATAAYAVFDPETGALAVASSGHLPGVIVGHGVVRLLDFPVEAPLGALTYTSGEDFETKLAIGETLLFYTDGLVERRGVPLTDSIDELLQIVRPATSPEEVCRRAIEQLVLEGLADDVAIVAVQNCEIPTDLQLRMPANPGALTQVRRILRRWLRNLGAGEDDTTEITIAVSEACANAVEHAYSPAPAEFEVWASESDGEVTIVVRDTGRWRDPRHHDRGRGLKIMHAAMDVVEVSSGVAGTEVIMRREIHR
ncbi:MAG: SpoIIE family protein phosphatase, partial [Solirubrobacteraceae bacterium]